jgi:hypothetical protein
MKSLTDYQHERMPGFHFARIVAAACELDDADLRRRVIQSAHTLLDRGDR